MKTLIALVFAFVASVSLARSCSAATYSDAPNSSLPENHLAASFANAPCALAGERALTSEVEGEDFDFESTYEAAFDACERDSAAVCE